MSIQPPKIDERTSEDIVARVETLTEAYTAWRSHDDGPLDAAQALMRIFGRMAELIIERLNQTPDKNFLAFLDLIGTQILPPQPARVLLTFQLAAGSPTDTRVPARTQVASPPAEGEEAEVLFETDQELTVTTARLAAVYVRNPDTDLYANYTLSATGDTTATFPAFQGNQPIEHSLYLARDDFFMLPTPKSARLTITSDDAARLAALPILWTYWDGVDWQELTDITSSLPSDREWALDISELPPPTPKTRNDVTAGWLRGQLDIPLPPGEPADEDEASAEGEENEIHRSGLPPTKAMNGQNLLDLSVPFSPFSDSGLLPNFFYLEVEEAFVRAGAMVTLAVTLVQSGRATSDLRLDWHYSDGSGWLPLGASTPLDPSADSSAFGFADETLAFTRDSTVEFTVPTDWRPHTHFNQTGRWLRVQISAGGYDDGAEQRFPQIATLTTAYRWQLPQIEQITASVRVERGDLIPELGFSNVLPLDLTKDFYPFGEKPRLSDTLYLAHGETFAQAGTEASITIQLTNPNPDQKAPDPQEPPLQLPPVLASSDLVIAWEVGSTKGWLELGRSSPNSPPLSDGPSRFVDNTQAFTRNGTVEFIVPPEAAVQTVNGESRYWLRARIIQGNYGHEAYYRAVRDSQTNGTVYELVPATFAPPVVASAVLGYLYEPQGPLATCLTYNDFTYVDHTTTAQSSDLTFKPFTPTTHTDPALYLGFDRPFANRTMTLYVGVEVPIYSLESEMDRRAATDDPAQVIWEYGRAGAWTSLGAQDETQALAERGLIRFVGPRDLTTHPDFDNEAYWLRARWDKGTFASPPILQRVLTNTTWASQALTIQGENLGSSNGEPDQIFQTTSVPVLLDPQLEVREPELPSATERTQLVQEEGEDAINTVEDNSGRPTEIWVRWHQVPDFYGSGPRDRHYVLDHLTGRIYFGDGQHGLIPPQGRNTLRLARYRTGGGTRGNRAAGAVTQLKSAVPYVDGVTNHEAASGGAEAETLERVKARGPKALRHRDRAVTAQDAEDLAYAASASVARALALPAKDELNAGQIGLILVPQSSEEQPIPSLELINRVEEYILDRAAPTLDLWLAGPDWVKVTVKAEVAPVSFEAVDLLAATIVATLQRFLHPLTGGLDSNGWDFGRQPHRSDLYVLLESIQGVDYVRSLEVTEEPQGPVRSDRFLVYSGQHSITVVSPVGESV